MKIRFCRVGGDSRGGCQNAASLGAARPAAILQRGSGDLQRGSVRSRAQEVARLWILPVSAINADSSHPVSRRHPMGVKAAPSACGVSACRDLAISSDHQTGGAQ
jgi:hypothetical protein